MNTSQSPSFIYVRPSMCVSRNYDTVKPFYFLQIAGFGNPINGLHEARAFLVNGQGNEFLEVQNLMLTKKQYKQIYKTVSPSRYKLYSLITLKDLPPPSTSEIMIARSGLINGSNSIF